MHKRTFLFLAAIILPVITVCKKKDSAGYELNERLPELIVGHVYWKERHTPEEEKRAVDGIMKQMAGLMTMLEKKDFSALPENVSREKGIYTDLKAHKTYEEIKREVAKSDGYLQTFFLNTDRLRAHTEDPAQLSVRDVFRLTTRVKVDFYMESGQDQCELRLFLLDSPENNFRLNNPVFIREQNSWKVYRLF